MMNEPMNEQQMQPYFIPSWLFVFKNSSWLSCGMQASTVHKQWLKCSSDLWQAKGHTCFTKWAFVRINCVYVTYYHKILLPLINGEMTWTQNWNISNWVSLFGTEQLPYTLVIWWVSSLQNIPKNLVLSYILGLISPTSHFIAEYIWSIYIASQMVSS